MGPADVDVLALAARRLSWNDQRQQVLAQNVANADTPGYRPRDLADFGQTLGAALGRLPMTRTSALDIAPQDGNGDGRDIVPEERAPDGNAVSLQQELAKVADTETSQQLVLNLYKTYQGLFRTVIGKG